MYRPVTLPTALSFFYFFFFFTPFFSLSFFLFILFLFLSFSSFFLLHALFLFSRFFFFLSLPISSLSFFLPLFLQNGAFLLRSEHSKHRCFLFFNLTISHGCISKIRPGFSVIYGFCLVYLVVIFGINKL